MPAAKEEAKRPCPRARPCVGLQVCGAECAFGKNCSPPMQTLQRRSCQTRARSRKKACAYGVRVSGATIFAYVEGNPLLFVDPEGLQTSVQWCYQSPANAATCNEAGMLPKPIRIPPPIVFPDDCNKAREKAIVDASNAYWKLTTKRLPQYESGGTRGRDAGHGKAIPQLQEALKDAIRRVRLHCTTLPAMLPEWERAANEPLPR